MKHSKQGTTDRRQKSISTISIVTYHHLLNDEHISFNEIGLNAHVTNQRVCRIVCNIFIDGVE